MQQINCDCLRFEHLKFIETTAYLEKGQSDFKKLVEDFEHSYFKGIFCNSENNEILGYILYHYSYSTWEAREIYISDLYIKPKNFQNISKETIFETMTLKLIEIARSMRCSCINYKIDMAKDAELETLFEKTKANGVNLTKLERWVFFHMDYDILDEFSKIDSEKFEIDLLNEKIKIRKINIDTDCDKIWRRIFKSVDLHQMIDQLSLTSEDLYKDYKTPDKDTLDKFYYCFVAESSRTNKIISYTVYYYNYSLKKGLGCFLIDLYVEAGWRKYGIGTLMWRKVALDCLNNNAQYMEWICADWNKIAIDYYTKYGAYNATEKSSFNMISIGKDRIFSDVYN